ncbi:nucleotide pyrophosphohydrolase [Pelagicoccus albus]|uniref:Nucleotide pyrophosphohydrolase n=1 Tax=Pelagicoccus albus TaxID=415222 RepID=A0A7X1B3Y7_9BACT|nr:nucleotide pyrophosphohydrolase [Pelagicoccus albus]MBC2605200.1 nucleotide pyrophosphohydrolase [Pelagicoccus albus]
MPLDPLSQLTEKLTAFRDDRDWKQFHNPKDLAIALSIEAAELQEIFLWKKPEEVSGTVSKKRVQIEEEVADIASYLLLLCHEMGIDLNKAVSSKIEKNAAKYPVEKAKGTHAKYDEL